MGKVGTSMNLHFWDGVLAHIGDLGGRGMVARDGVDARRTRGMVWQ